MKKVVLAIALLLFAVPALAGPLETSFHPGLPLDLEFGDSPERIIKKMGREPDHQAGGRNPGLYAYLLDEAQPWPPARLEYRFAGGRLIDLTLNCWPLIINHDDYHREVRSRPVLELYDYLTGLYGPYQPCGHESGCPFLPVAFWIKKDQALFLVPESTPWTGDETKTVHLRLWLGPLTDDGKVEQPFRLDECENDEVDEGRGPQLGEDLK